MRRLRIFMTLLVALFGLLATAVPASAAPAPAGPAPAAATATYKVWHWNISGHEHGGTAGQITNTVLGSLSFRNPDFISVNEVCPQQYKAILEGLKAAGWPESQTNFARFEPMPHATNDLCVSQGGGADTDPYGVAVFSRFAPNGTDRITLPYDGVRARKLLCVSVPKPGDPRFCTTHIATNNTKGAQLAAVRNQLVDWSTDKPGNPADTVIAAGDYNTQPNDPLLDSWYAPSVTGANNPAPNTGIFRELDDQDPSCPGYGEQTTEGSLGNTCGKPAKVDSIYAVESRLISYDADSHPISQTACGGPCSNHRIVDGTLTIPVP